MMEDPTIIRLNIRHLEEVLKLHIPSATRETVITLLSEARRQLSMALDEAADRRR